MKSKLPKIMNPRLFLRKFTLPNNFRKSQVMRKTNQEKSLSRKIINQLKSIRVTNLSLHTMQKSKRDLALLPEFLK